MDLNKFDEPFSPEDIEWRIQQSGKTRDGKVWAMVLAYVTNRAIMKRLDDVCGKAGWRNEYRDITVSNKDSNLSSKGITANHLWILTTISPLHQ